jgi:two-component system sensor histidine kinase AlgZ
LATAREAGATRKETSAVEGFVIPDLCTVQALAVVVIAAELLALVVTLIDPAPGWVRFAIVSLFVQWSALGSAGALCLARHRLARFSPVAGGLGAWVLVVAVIALFAVIGELAVTGNAGAGVRALLGEPAPLGVVAPDWVDVARTIAIGVLVSGMLLRYLYLQQTLRSREQSELRLRLQALQSRIRPHFLFNSMNIIASLIETDPETAEAVVEDLSELFRASLNEAGNQVPLQTELDLCDRYVRIETLRLGERLRVHWDTDPIPHGVEIPLLTLQPLVENAIYHGIQPLPHGGDIDIAIRIGATHVEVTMSNPVPPADANESHARGNRMALANIRSRLGVLYGGTASLTTAVETTDGDERYLTRLSYPVSRGPAVTGTDRASNRLRGHG